MRDTGEGRGRGREKERELSCPIRIEGTPTNTKFFCKQYIDKKSNMVLLVAIEVNYQ